MIKVNEIAFVAHPVADKQRARDFYEGVLGLKPTMDSDFPEGFWVEYELGPHTLALSNFWKPLRQPVQAGPTVGLEVENFEETVAALQEESVTFLMDSLETPVCHLAVIQDPDGNSLFIHKRKPGHS
jgi:catechol 2,3-dioxygenase-like lactoylglutathione lyase family enzyme